MIKIIDTYGQINDIFENKTFCYEKWEKYINSIYTDCAHIFKNEIDEYTKTGEYTFEKEFLPHINAVWHNPKLELLHNSFIEVIAGLNERIMKEFSKELNVDIVFYLGLGNAAGWVTQINENDTILLGVEKIIELDWCDKASMYGLIYHELGHVYHAQYGELEQEVKENEKNYVWQLFVEGIAMYVEQALVGDFTYFHQDVKGWKTWCEEHFAQILHDFDVDLPEMTQFTQRYFGDWADYHGYGDVGYYLGNRFVHELLKQYSLDELIGFDIEYVYELYHEFVVSYS